MRSLPSSGKYRKRDIPEPRRKHGKKIIFYIPINHHMALSKEQEFCLEEIKRETRHFEASLRTSFNARNPDNHIAIQRVNSECIRLKTKVQNLALQITGTDIFRTSSTIDSAMFYISKYETVIARGLELDGDILILAGKLG